MRYSRTSLLHAILLVPALLFPQGGRQELNDQMWEAVRKGDTATVKALLDKGADVNAKFRYGTTALFKAAERGNVDVVNLLLERGADVKVKDTFYGATAMTWALQNAHIEVVGALLKKSPDDVEDVLLTGARSGNAKLVKVALDQGGCKPESLTVALVAATTGESKNTEAAALLKKAGAALPTALDGPTMQAYSGTYKNEQGRELVVSATDGMIMLAATGQPPIALVPIDKTSFRPRDFDGLNISFNVDAGKATGVTVKQGPQTTLYKRSEAAKQP